MQGGRLPAGRPAGSQHLGQHLPPTGGNRTSGSRAAISFAAAIHQTQDPGSTGWDCKVESCRTQKFPSKKFLLNRLEGIQCGSTVMRRRPSNSIQCWVQLMRVWVERGASVTGINVNEEEERRKREAATDKIF